MQPTKGALARIDLHIRLDHKQTADVVAKGLETTGVFLGSRGRVLWLGRSGLGGDMLMLQCTLDVTHLSPLSPLLLRLKVVRPPVRLDGQNQGNFHEIGSRTRGG